MQATDLRLYAITDRSWLNGRNLEDDVRRSLEGGVTCVQYREKHLLEQEFITEAKKVQQVCKEYGVPFILNDDVELAKKLHADGVHVGQKDMSVSEARKILGEDMIIGASARTVEQAKLAEQQGANYLGVGAVFGTNTKDDAKTINVEILKSICEAVTIPVVAIGGVTKENISKLQKSGICGVAVISAIFAQEDITKQAAELRKCVQEVIDDERTS